MWITLWTTGETSDTKVKKAFFKAFSGTLSGVDENACEDKKQKYFRIIEGGKDLCLLS